MIERKKDLDDSFIWILEKSEIDDEKISISNALYKEPLYAASYFVRFYVLILKLYFKILFDLNLNQDERKYFYMGMAWA